MITIGISTSKVRSSVLRSHTSIPLTSCFGTSSKNASALVLPRPSKELNDISVDEFGHLFSQLSDKVIADAKVRLSAGGDLV